MTSEQLVKGNNLQQQIEFYEGEIKLLKQIKENNPVVVFHDPKQHIAVELELKRLPDLFDKMSKPLLQDYQKRLNFLKEQFKNL